MIGLGTRVVTFRREEMVNVWIIVAFVVDIRTLLFLLLSEN